MAAPGRRRDGWAVRTACVTDCLAHRTSDGLPCLQALFLRMLQLDALGLPRDIELTYLVPSRATAGMRYARRSRAAHLDCMTKIRGSAAAEARGWRLIILDRQQPARVAQRTVARRAKILICMMNQRRLGQEAVNVRIEETAVRSR